MESQPQTHPNRGRPLPNQNAPKYGLSSDVTLLPNDDAQEFYALRRELYQSYRPRNRQEAARVEAMASLEWRLARCRRFQTVYDGHVDALLYPDAQPAAHICEKDAHIWSHRADDCTRQEGRLQRALRHERELLSQMQRERRQERIASLEEGEPIFWGAERAAGQTGATDPHPAATGDDVEPRHDVMRPPEAGGLGGNGVGLACSDDGRSRPAPAAVPPPGAGQPSPERKPSAEDAANPSHCGNVGGAGGALPVLASGSSKGESGKYDERTAAPNADEARAIVSRASGHAPAPTPPAPGCIVLDSREGGRSGGTAARDMLPPHGPHLHGRDEWFQPPEVIRATWPVQARAWVQEPIGITAVSSAG